MNQDAFSRREAIERLGLLAAGATAAGASSAWATPPQSTPELPSDERFSFNVRAFGAKGDGVADDTAPAQAAIDAALKAGGGRIHFPSGTYRISRALAFTREERVDVTGEGLSTTLLHENSEPVFLWKEKVACLESSIRDLRFVSARNDKSPDVPVIHFTSGCARTLISRVSMEGKIAHLRTSRVKHKMGSGIFFDRWLNTVTIEHCTLWGITGTGIRTMDGSELRIIGGRIMGAADPWTGIARGSIGIELRSNLGGVHVATTDVIALDTGMKIGSQGNRSNREIIITHASFDSSIHGIWVTDQSYVSIAGMWSASSDEDQILIDKDSAGAIMVISGGTIYNGGAYGRPGNKHGIVVRAGSFVMNGVTVRTNRGTGILIEGEAVRDWAITGCRICENGTGAVLAGNFYTFTGNVLTRNVVQLVDRGGPDKQVQGNVCQK